MSGFQRGFEWKGFKYRFKRRYRFKQYLKSRSEKRSFFYYLKIRIAARKSADGKKLVGWIKQRLELRKMGIF